MSESRINPHPAGADTGLLEAEEIENIGAHVMILSVKGRRSYNRLSFILFHCRIFY